jgi:hypothetical protein
MAGKREKPEEIVSKLGQGEVLQGQGATIAEALWRDAAFAACPVKGAQEREPAAAARGV